MLRFRTANVLVLTIALFSSCSLFNKQGNNNYDCARYQIFHDPKFERKSSSENDVIIQGVTKYCNDNRIAKGTIIRIIDEIDKVILHTVSDSKGRYKLICKSGTFRISALNPGGGIVETSLIDFGLHSMSTKIDLYLQHSNAFIEKMEDPRNKKN